jgi:hypothetical protein
MAAIQWVTISVSNNFFICQRILPRFLWILYLSYSAISWKLTWCWFFSCNVSGNAISGSLSFSLKFYTLRTLIRNVNNVVCVSASHAQRPCVSLDITICIPCLFTLYISALWRYSVEYYIKTSYFNIWSAIELIWRFNSRLLASQSEIISL